MKSFILAVTTALVMTGAAGADEWYKRSEKKEEFYRSSPDKVVVPLREPDYIILREPRFRTPNLTVREYKFGLFRKPKRITEYRFYLDEVNDR